MKATRYQDSTTRRSWLEFPGKPEPEVIAALKANGWRWGGYRKAWHHPSRYATAPAGIEVEDGGKVDWAAERAERLEDRAANATVKANGFAARAHAIADNIPFGQPILVGHHSERHARKDAERIRSGFDKAGEAYSKAEHLAGAAHASRAHQAHLAAPGTIARRIERLSAELRKLERQIARGPGCASAVSEYTVDDVARWTVITDELRAEIAENQAQLAATGGLKADRLEVKVGDVIGVHGGFAVRVSRVNPKSYSGMIVAGGAAGHTGKWERSEVSSVVARAGEPFAITPADQERIDEKARWHAAAVADAEKRERRTKEAVVWRTTHADFRGTREDGTRVILVLRTGGTTSVALSDLTEAELAEKHAYGTRKEERDREALKEKRLRAAGLMDDVQA